MHARQTSEWRKVGAAVSPRSVCWHAELIVRSSGCYGAGTGDQDKVGEHQEGDGGRILEMRATPWSPESSDNAFDIQIGKERPAEMVPRVLGEVLMENKVAKTYFRRADFEQWGLSEGCLGCRYLRKGQGRQQAHSEAYGKRIEGLSKGDSVGAARLSAADERINRALADAVERHAAKDPGVRGILKGASATCHPESKFQKKIALDTEQESTPRPSVSHGGSTASGYDERDGTRTHTRRDPTKQRRRHW